MEWYEIGAVFKYSYYRVKDSWEQARMIAATVAAPNSKTKINSFSDFCSFPWEEDKEEVKKLTETDINRIKELKKYGKLCNNT